jgi:hypothetical protein
MRSVRGWESVGRRVIGALVAAVAAAGFLANGQGVAAARNHPGRIPVPEIDLSFANRDIVFTDATHWTVPIRPARQGGGACQGEYIPPQITAGPGGGTSVYYGVKYFCTQPVEYTITLGIDEVDSSGLRHSADSRVRSGVSQNPYLDSNTPLCRTNRNSGWVPWDETTIMGQTKYAQAQVVTTVGCTLNNT